MSSRDAERPAPRGRATLGALTLLGLGVNGIVGVGIFVAPRSVAAAVPGPRGALLYLALALACVPVALVYARLSRAMPRDGGPALYAREAFGPGFAQAIAMLCWVSALFSTAAVTRALAERLAPGRTGLVAVALCLGLALVNARGLALSASAWTALTVLKLTPLLALAVLGLRAAAPAVPPSPTGPLGPALLAILFSLQGFEIVALPAGQSTDAARTVPRATVASLVLAGALYAAVHLACVRATPTVGADAIPAAAGVLGGARLSRAVDLGVLFSIAGIVVGMHAMTPRYLAAVRPTDDRAAPPAWALVPTAVLAAAFSASSSLAELLDLSSVAVLAQYGASAAALLVLARRRALGLGARDAWPVLPSFGVVAVLLLQARPRELLLAAGVTLGATVVLRGILRQA